MVVKVFRRRPAGISTGTPAVVDAIRHQRSPFSGRRIFRPRPMGVFYGPPTPPPNFRRRHAVYIAGRMPEIWRQERYDRLLDLTAKLRAIRRRRRAHLASRAPFPTRVRRYPRDRVVPSSQPLSTQASVDLLPPGRARRRVFRQLYEREMDRQFPPSLAHPTWGAPLNTQIEFVPVRNPGGFFGGFN